MLELHTDKIFQIENLRIGSGEKTIIDNFDFSFRKGDIHSLVGESGSGKSSFANLLLGLLPEDLNLSWSAFEIFGETISVGDFHLWEKWRGKRISFIPQTSAIGLHPFLTIGSQILEYFSILDPSLANVNSGLNLLEEFGLSDPAAAWKSRPHQLSGGERQRVLILLSMYSGAELILADEPTSALDPATGKAILELLEKRVREYRSSLLFISHDLASAKYFADTITVMKSGKHIETLVKTDGDWFPQSAYARKLFDLEKNLA